MEGISLLASADGETSDLLAGAFGMSWLSLMGLTIVVLLLLPNIIFTVKGQTTGCYIKGWLDNVEKVTRITTMFLMIFQFGIFEVGFPSILAFFIYFCGNIILLAVYWVLWILYKKKQTQKRRQLLVEIPCVVYILCALTMKHWLLLASAIIFSVSHMRIQQEKMKLVAFSDEEADNIVE